ncbi:MAG: ABC transporter ATP-binding protein [Opitutaceae bacterium]|nr:ABC transporter ATP-binding protein [Cytophagales bacterium]
MKELKFLNKYFWKYRYRLILGLIFIVISNYFAVKPAVYVRDALDLVKNAVVDIKQKTGVVDTTILVDEFGRQVVIYGLLILAMAFMRGVFLFFMRQTIIVMSRLIEFDLKNEVYNHYQTLPLSFYRKNNTGDLMSRISEDVNKVRMYLGPAIMYGINMVVLFTLTIGHMISVNPRLTLYVLMPLPILSFLIYKVNSIMEARSEVIQRNLAGLSTFVQETFSGIRVIKAFVREDNVIEQFTEASEKYKEASLSLTKVNAYFQPLIIGLIGLSTVLTIYLGGIEVTKGNITTGNIAEFVIYVNMLTWPVTSLGWTISLTQSAEASQKRINEFLKTKTDIVSDKDLIVPIKGTLEFKNVSLTYPDSGIEALKDISFKIEAGKSLGILGSTGSGKSTLANLICRMYDPTSGKVLMDDHDLKDLNPQNLRHYIGYVPQDVFLFSDSIRNNIAFGGDENIEESIVRAARQADLYDNVMSFEHKFETVIGERGITLSGGQKQRTSIARALIKNPKVLILDDCLSAVDTKTENTILNNLQEVVGNCTSVIISHRISSLKLADYILVLDEGKIVEEGTHEALLKIQNGTYKLLFEKQMRGEDATVA